MKNKNIMLAILFFLSIQTFAQSVIVNPDGTHSILTNNVIVNPNGTHSTMSNNVIVNPDGTHSIISNNIIINPNGTHSIIVNNNPILDSNDTQSKIIDNTIAKPNYESVNDTILSKRQIKKLKEELSLIKKFDQNLRKLFIPDITDEKRKNILSELNISEEEFKNKGWQITEEHDSLNLKKVEKIINKYGYPSKKNVGEELHNVIWLVIQHSELSKIEKYFPLMEKANKKGDLEDKYIALMKDRMLMYQGKEQIYGTQIAGRMFIDPITKKEIEWKDFIWPIQDWNNVNELRKSVGINQTIEELAKSMGIEDISKKYTIEEIQTLTK